MCVNFICLCMRFVFVYILLCDECFDVTSDLTIKNSHLMHWICTSRKGKTRHSLCSPEILLTMDHPNWGNADGSGSNTAGLNEFGNFAGW